ncbi:pyridine nucleotide-disulfide oxidoreductase family protein [Mycobacterium kansasii 732]|uniref:Baeyer-Villiger monooxygenase n=1 Tax=Mycobacterium pseudokansasii TaxID=2341080 RepID=A0A498QLV2_9MYCO|nr:NAD(P)/FAD-dependent oxidoreductase [Mycobacterium pseudokansasii]EUA15304.1 pyridine nucleotide-disulfide oxidoreductase family protein [Mycobacterium kansasii 732]MBY0389008.1 NAD(P)/FAD-dependent oxidoreductase [Mycobacterium pseudokansasii]VAZ89008.1 Baeyer-Villiger monooxygenase [Mycobacterium pseudokansasii]VAZ89587.1 Baeyer-Villiger monooxygenase [Mycobacterium pseudokansasii]VBA47137.1 Baeyer-Villiger monooxygenase [Mycobacterium pseudokansasii]
MGLKPRVAVIGAGAGGIAMGIQLAAGGYDFTIFDRADGFGGTWRHNTFPGAACDVPSHLYSYSFAPNPRWSKTYANQPEILAYLEKVAADYGLQAQLRPNTAVITARWSDARKRWMLTTDDGRRHEFEVVVSAVGMLDLPSIPDIPGTQRFRGRRFHSARWDHSKSTAGERVASIGTGASAIQYVPAIAPRTAQLTVFQRTPIWISPRFDIPFTAEQQELFECDPAAARKLRDEAFDSYESSSFDIDAAQTSEATELARGYLLRKVADPALRAKLTPDYPVGCKRPLMSRDWYPTFSLPNVSLETTAIAELTEHGVRTVDGVEHRVDTVIYGTGFKAADYLASIDVYGTGGRRLREDWRDGAEAYLGTLVAGYPNFFTLYGPNTNGVNSIIYIHEAQTTFIRHILDVLTGRRARTVEVTPAAQRRYNDEIQAAMEGKVWLACANYFRHPSGKVVTQLPYSGRTFFERTRAMVPGDYWIQ